jgi:hypothetical protein
LKIAYQQAMAAHDRTVKPGEIMIMTKLKATHALLVVALAVGGLGGGARAQTAASGFVELPADIDCSLRGISYESRVGANGQMVSTAGSVQGVTCWMTNSPNNKKEIALAATTIANGMLPTKEFGDLQITPINSLTSVGVFMAIGSDKLQAFKDYLQK